MPKTHTHTHVLVDWRPRIIHQGERKKRTLQKKRKMGAGEGKNGANWLGAMIGRSNEEKDLTSEQRRKLFPDLQTFFSFLPFPLMIFFSKMQRLPLLLPLILLRSPRIPGRRKQKLGTKTNLFVSFWQTQQKQFHEIHNNSEFSFAVVCRKIRYPMPPKK